ncbi:hypothetical protein MUB24_05400 [Lederbergia sp. NSJ-179]|uniref:competence protein CoiA n=1 Tax=Lederbergia sp. NSJ-179 TaxID=2931402 RepID=UPI001FD0F232|nr:competence protein CoiA family protein [Lederbergia sp. NSJ-179]MCJ7840360.1 hypothetical protein [Lederbergia sp. NSJ-179]
MLTALNQEGKLVSLVHTPKTFTKQERSSFFYCPACKEPLILKAGKIRIPHFAHKREANCSFLFAEPESPQHLLGKKHLYTHYKRQGLDVHLEYYLSEIQQRPDLFVKKENQAYAIEYQCSPLSRNRLKERTDGYRKMGILPIWIIGGPPYKKRKNTSYELSDFHWSLSRHNAHSGLTLLSYLPEKKNFQQLSQITAITSTKVVALFHEFPLFRTNNSNHFPIDPKHDTLNWLNEKRNWLQNKVYYGNLVSDLFLKEVYATGNNPFLLPEICGIPLPHAHLFYEPPMVWQFYIYYDCLRGLAVGQKISLKWVKQKLSTRLNKGSITIREFPLDFDPQHTWERAMTEYFFMLTILEYFSKIGEDLFVMEKIVKIPKNIEDMHAKENALFRKITVHNLFNPSQ